MKEVFFYLFYAIFLVLVLSFERVFGLPVLYLAGVIIIFSRINGMAQIFMSAILGFVLAVFYSFSFWLGVGLTGFILFGFSYLKKFITSSSLRLLILVLLANLLISFRINYSWEFWSIIYHLAILLVLFLVLIFMAGINVNKSGIRISKRFRNER